MPQALGVNIRLKRRTNRVVSRTSSEGEATGHSEIRVLDDNFTEQYHREDRPKISDKKQKTLRFGGGPRSFSSRRQQFTLWKGQAASNAVKVLRGCYSLARRELTAWRSRTKATCTEERTSEIKATLRGESNSSKGLKRPRSYSRTSVTSSNSIVSSLSSTTELENEHQKELIRSEFSLRVRRSSSLEMKPSLHGFTETTSGNHERLLLVNALPLNDEDEDDDSSLTSHHLPFRSVWINGHVRVLHNEWV
ncbi:hypothetical protein GN244_ATG13005 [Phytophthora infestans]|uniref:Uncharacterized protein n=1 Tax=Phytophthora infestans TaxID=4787 RepID=A0A833RM59_PHYIN|nr:hypothetical protein GN244_ATG20890 [Phytophthora infestans]KAF4034989.1 hypothetical protein GN244_ATG13005 [Phytophthora infestans]